MNESDFTKKLHKYLPEQIKAWKIRDDYQGGIPDAAYFCKNKTIESQIVFCEYKYLKTLPKRDCTLIIPKLTLQQKIWIELLQGMKVPTFVIVGFGNQGVIFSTLELCENGMTKQDFETNLLDIRTLAANLTNAVLKN